MTIQEFSLELLKWLGGGGVALLGLFLTKKQDKHKDKKQDEYNIINELQEENKRKDERLDKQDEKIQYLVDQMEEMRKEMFAIQSDKHRSEIKNIELKSENDRLVVENEKMSRRLFDITTEKNALIENLQIELNQTRKELNSRIDRLIKENEDLRRQVMDIKQLND